MMKNGHVMAVLRPADPELAKRLAEECVASGRTGEESERAFNAILQSQPYTYVGIAEHTQHKQKGFHRLLDRETREVIGEIRAWDSFIALDQLEELVAIQAHEVEAKAIVDAALADSKKTETE